MEPTKATEVSFAVGSQLYKFDKIGMKWQAPYKENRVHCTGEKFTGPDGLTYPSAVVSATYKVQYLIRVGFVSNTHISMEYDDNR